MSSAVGREGSDGGGAMLAVFRRAESVASPPESTTRTRQCTASAFVDAAEADASMTDLSLGTAEALPARTELPLEAAMAGDAAAIRKIVESLMPDAFRVAVSVLGEHHPELDDAVQMGTLTVIKQLGAFRGEGGFRGFAMRIVSRTALAVRRSEKRSAKLAERIRSNDGIACDEEVLDDTDDSADAVLRRVMSELLQTLPEEQAQTLLLRFVLEYELTEIAAETGVPVNTVRSRLRLAREALRRKIERAPNLTDLADGRTLTIKKGGAGDE